MEIALFGGSFDPPHVGHLLAASWVLLTEPIDELWFVPVFQHPFAKPMIASFEERASLCEAAVSSLGLQRARVSRAEAQVGKDGRTVDLLEHLHRLHPGDSFALVMGSDILQETAHWKSWDRVQELARIIRVQRSGHELPEFRAAVLPAVSSTDLRARLAAGSDVSGLLPLAVERALRVSGTYGLSIEAGSPLSSMPR
jgi:nicotinate-nucleotide adenylyltransferase